MTTPPRPPQQPAGHSSDESTILLVVAWLFVGLPLAWGVIQTVIKSMALFH